MRACWYGKTLPALDNDTMQGLTSYAWPGNVTELEMSSKEQLLLIHLVRVLDLTDGIGRKQPIMGISRRALYRLAERFGITMK